jgi:hypothetical protein
MTRRAIPCPHCGKKAATDDGLRMHVKMKHKGKPCAVRPQKKRTMADYEPTMAETLIDAQIDAAMGIDPPEWIENMFPDSFRGRS